MKSILILLAILICMVNTRSVHESDGNQKHRHRRRLRTPYNDYNNDYYDRFEPRHGDEYLLEQVKSLLNELIEQLKRPPPPPPAPQIIYVPYPMPPCTSFSVGTRVLNYDPSRYWTTTGNKFLNYDDGKDGARPAVLKPEEEPIPDGFVSSEEEEIKTTTKAPAALNKNRICLVAIVICCGEGQDELARSKCFSAYPCSMTYNTGMACNKTIVKKAFEELISAYGPTSNS